MPALSISRLEDYDIDPVTGFLPRIPPLKRLPNPYYQPWEDVVDDLNGLLLAGRLRERVHEVGEVFDKSYRRDFSGALKSHPKCLPICFFSSPFSTPHNLKTSVNISARFLFSACCLMDTSGASMKSCQR